MLAPASIETSPIICAAGSTYASGCTRGVRPGTARIIRSSDRGDGGDLDQILGRREAGLDGRARRRILRIHPRLPRGVHLVVGLHVDQVHRRGEQLALVAAGLSQQAVDLLEDLRGLPLDVGSITGHLSGHIHRIAVNDGGAEARTDTESLDGHESSLSHGMLGPRNDRGSRRECRGGHVYYARRPPIGGRTMRDAKVLTFATLPVFERGGGVQTLLLTSKEIAARLT